MNVQLISVGTELLLGDIVNTNAQYLSQSLAELGVNVYKQVTVGDNRKRLMSSLHEAFCESDVVIITGGLGPTDDDITRECVSQYMQMPLRFDEMLWCEIEQFMKRNRSNCVITENNKKQAYVPEGATILYNEIGTAPGLLLQKENQTAILLPGPPFEMKHLFNSYVKDFFKKQQQEVFVSRYIRCYGIGESTLETQLKDILDAQTNPTIALYAKTGEVMIRVTASAHNSKEAIEKIDAIINIIQERIGEYIYLISDDSQSDSQSQLHQVLAQLLLENHLTMSTAESLTGGEIAAKLIEIPKISQSFIEGVVAYANDSKIATLSVPTDVLKEYGAVSEQTAIAMVEGIVKRTNSDCAIATTGIAGPDSDGTDKPVGLVYIATYMKGNIIVKEYHFNGDRQRIRQRATSSAFDQLRRMIEHEIRL